ncbi:MAG: hypothetical protein J5565_02160 [Muribaculaceae bacterium]|nr:hypothetical protein [Muribaculaceae bacterium]
MKNGAPLSLHPSLYYVMLYSFDDVLLREDKVDKGVHAFYIHLTVSVRVGSEVT